MNYPLVIIIGLLGFRISGVENVDLSSSYSREMLVSDLPQLLGTDEGIQSLYEEFSNIEGGQRRPWIVASQSSNIKKNRYEELLAFDHSRVLIKAHPNCSSPMSDYINANYIDGQNSEKEYVATQGPLQHTIKDFWSMIWLLNATKIVMLANLVEHGKEKVSKYWPEKSSTYGGIEVTKVKEYPIPGLQHVIRTFSIEKKDSVKPRFVRQFHFTGWPDLGVPEDRIGVLSIIRQARIYDPKNKAPIVIHCSAGVGRTGTVILLDAMIQRAKAVGTVDFPNRLNHMRLLRPDVVEKKEQYVFAHQAVSEFFNDPKTKKRLKDIENLYWLIGILSSPTSANPITEPYDKGQT